MEFLHSGLAVAAVALSFGTCTLTVVQCKAKTRNNRHRNRSRCFTHHRRKPFLSYLSIKMKAKKHDPLIYSKQNNIHLCQTLTSVLSWILQSERDSTVSDFCQKSYFTFCPGLVLYLCRDTVLKKLLLVVSD